MIIPFLCQNIKWVRNEGDRQIAGRFNIDAVELKPITSGLINHTYRVADAAGRSYLLQRINSNVFKQPLDIQENFVAISKVLSGVFILPELIKTRSGELLFVDDIEAWRCFSFIENSFAPAHIENEEMAYELAHCFGTFTRLLSKAQASLHTILPRFHDLIWRMKQLEDAEKTADETRLNKCNQMLAWVEEYDWLMKQYEYWIENPALFPQRILHHDCKVSNILFDTASKTLIGPIDLDTAQPGLFFSDLGDMIRSIASSHDENHRNIDELYIRENYLNAVMEGYKEATSGLWTMEEEKALPHSGHILVYMQAIRFLADYLNNDAYYQVRYPEQNFDRAMNQWQVLQLLGK